MKPKLAIVVSDFNREITGEMLTLAQKRAKELKVEIIKIIKVPGAFEIPLAVKQLLENKSIEGVITLGAVIKGGTGHDEVIMHSVAGKLLELSVEYKKPVSLGILGPNITWEQSKKRAKEYAARAVDAVIEVLKGKNKKWLISNKKPKNL